MHEVFVPLTGVTIINCTLVKQREDWQIGIVKHLCRVKTLSLFQCCNTLDMTSMAFLLVQLTHLQIAVLYIYNFEYDHFPVSLEKFVCYLVILITYNNIELYQHLFKICLLQQLSQ